VPRHRIPGRLHLAAAVAVAALAAVVGCQGTAPTVLGYKLGSEHLYDETIRTVYVPMFYNRALQTTPYRGMEVDITRAVVREIGSKTPYRVVSDPDRADTELLGNVVGIGKVILNRNQQNLTREEELLITVDVLWRDLRDGRILSAPRRGVGPGVALPIDPETIPLFDPDLPPPPPVIVVDAALPTRIIATGRLLPELGESSTTAQQRAVEQLATQIVSMMEKPW
jgi:hypothetical protein